jgi:tRNA nucleotidyltransferase/poly(A) polymerase
MGKIARQLIFGLVFIFNINAYADSFVVKLSKLSLEVDKAEIYAANCAIDAKESKTINESCATTNDLLLSLTQRFTLLINKNPSSVNDEKTAARIKEIKATLENANNHLTEAKIVTDDYQWTSSVVPNLNAK